MKITSIRNFHSPLITPALLCSNAISTVPFSSICSLRSSLNATDQVTPNTKLEATLLFGIQDSHCSISHFYMGSVLVNAEL
jgi:hypothetical protein